VKHVTTKIDDPTKGKVNFRLGSITTQRYRKPTNERTAGRMTQFIVDYSQQCACVPGGSPNAVVNSARTPKTMNAGGKAKVFGSTQTVFLGSSPDMPGRY
jgi:hypothetical protein